MAYVLKMKTRINGVYRMGVMPSNGFACTAHELPNEVFIRARQYFGIQEKSDIVLCRKYNDEATADSIAKSMESPDTVYFRRPANS